MFASRKFDITSIVRSRQLFDPSTMMPLTVLVYPPDYIGSVDGGGQGGDHEIARNAGALCFYLD